PFDRQKVAETRAIACTFPARRGSPSQEGKHEPWRVLTMSMKTLLHGGAATLVIAGTIGLGAAFAQSYSSYDKPTYHHTHHHHAIHRVHHARYAENERYRDENGPSYRESS